MIFCSQAGNNRHEHIMESLELFGREVLPEFRDRDEKAQRDKAQRLEPVDRAGDGAQAGVGPPAAARRITTRCRRFPRAIADRMDSDDFHAWLEDFAEKSAAGESDELNNLLGCGRRPRPTGRRSTRVRSGYAPRSQLARQGERQR